LCLVAEKENTKNWFVDCNKNRTKGKEYITIHWKKEKLRRSADTNPNWHTNKNENQWIDKEEKEKQKERDK